MTKFLLDKNRDYSQVLREYDDSGLTIVDYTYGDDLISQKRSSLKYFHYDGQMSTRQLTDTSQNITDGYTYDAFGILLSKFGATENNYLYTGEQYDPNVGFYYLRARYYNQNTGRFLTMDEFPGLMFEPLSLHKYLYCHGNPVNFIDPSGLNYELSGTGGGSLSLLEVIIVITIIAHLASMPRIRRPYFPMPTHPDDAKKDKEKFKTQPEPSPPKPGGPIKIPPDKPPRGWKYIFYKICELINNIFGSGSSEPPSPPGIPPTVPPAP